LEEPGKGVLLVDIGKSALYKLPKPVKIGNGKVSTIFFQLPH
jgi:hypothetical protein